MKKVKTISEEMGMEMELCSECDSWIEDGEDVYEDDKGYYVCEDCIK